MQAFQRDLRGLAKQGIAQSTIRFTQCAQRPRFELEDAAGACGTRSCCSVMRLDQGGIPNTSPALISPTSN